MADVDYYLKISNYLAGELDIRSALRAVKSEIVKVIELDHLDVCLIDEEDVFNTAYEAGARTIWSKSRTLISESPVREVLTGRTDAMVTSDATVDPRYTFPGSVSEPIQRLKLRSRINVAIKVLGRTVGSLNCSSRKANCYNDEHVQQVQNLAAILAPYFFALRANEAAKREAVRRAKIASQQEGLRLGALRLTVALERERQRIGMDLHDQTLADLTRLSRDLRPGMSLEETDGLQRRFQSCIQQLRGIIEASIPSILELFGFEEAVRAHFEGAKSPDQTIALNYSDASSGLIDGFDEYVRIALFRICQEAINNTLRHAAASKIAISLGVDEMDRFVLEIFDDGVFAAGEKSKPGGLMHMRTRARLIGAEFQVDRTDGTRLAVLLPLAEEIGG